MITTETSSDLDLAISKAYDWIVRVLEKQERVLPEQEILEAYKVSLGKNRLSDFAFKELYKFMLDEVGLNSNV